MLKTSLDRWLERGRRAHEQRAMWALPDYLLRDIGITRADLRQALYPPRAGR